MGFVRVRYGIARGVDFLGVIRYVSKSRCDVCRCVILFDRFVSSRFILGMGSGAGVR